MNALRYFVSGSLLTTLVACGGKTWSVQDARAQLDANQQKWEASDTDTYQVDYRGGQFLFSREVGLWKEIHVADGMVSKAILKETGIDIPREKYSDASYNIMTIDDAFLLISSLIDEDPYELKVTYNEELGFPELISVDQDLGVSEDEEAWAFTNFIPSP